MPLEQRLKAVEEKLEQIKDKKKDWLDITAIISSALTPVFVVILGAYFTYMQSTTDKEYEKQKTEQEHIRADAESKQAQIRADLESRIKQAEVSSKFFDILTMKEDEIKKNLAIDALFIAAPSYAPELVRALSVSPSISTEVTVYAKKALEKNRKKLITEMFNENHDDTKYAYSLLIASWSDDELLIDNLVSHGKKNKDSRNQKYKDGVYNIIKLLNHLPHDSLINKRDSICNFVNALTENDDKRTEAVKELRTKLNECN